MTDAAPHPAKFNEDIINAMAQLALSWSVPQSDSGWILDPFAGTGRGAALGPLLDMPWFGMEIEEVWVDGFQRTPWAMMIQGDSTVDLPKALRWMGSSLTLIATSPVYANRMTDSHNAREASKRNTYTHTLRRWMGDANFTLAKNNAGKMKGAEYRTLHRKVYAECAKVIRQDGKGYFILNYKNHMKLGAEVDMLSWHVKALQKVGFREIERRTVAARGLREGADSGRDQRVDHEWVVLFRFPRKES